VTIPLAQTPLEEVYKILIVEDNQDDALLTLHALKELGEQFRCEHVDSKEGFEVALDEVPHVIITDYSLPQFSAHDVLARVSEQGIDSSVIVISGTLSDQQAADLFRSGASDYLLKDRMARLGPAILDALNRQTLERNQRRAELELQQFFELSSDPMAILDLDLCVKRANRAWLQDLAWSPNALQDAKLVELTHPEDVGSVQEQLARLQNGHDARFEARFNLGGRAREDYHSLQWALRVETSLGRIFAVAHDVSDNRRLRVKLEHLANYDALTGLPNRRYFEQYFEKVCSHRRETDKRAFLAHMDLNKFKVINDTYGHVTADELLVAVAKRLAQSVRDNECVARMGGDEFVFLLEGTDANQIKRALTRIIAVLEQPYVLKDVEVKVGTSVGVTAIPAKGASFAESLRLADASMYRAKAGGGGIYFNVPGLVSPNTEKVWLEQQLRYALANQHLSCDYQPIFSLSTDTPVWYEALLRWHHPERGAISPAQFIPIAEEFGLINEVDRCALRLALTWAKGSGHKVAVNLAPQTLQTQDLPDYIGSLLEELALSPDLLHIEITERVLAEPETMLPQLSALRDLGVCIAVDDFGTGYSALSYLSTYPIDVLKLDRSFVKNLEWTESARTVAELIIRLAHDLSLQTVAEGVENQWQLDWLKSSGCDLAQGFFLRRPQASNDVTPPPSYLYN